MHVEDVSTAVLDPLPTQYEMDRTYSAALASDLRTRGEVYSADLVERLQENDSRAPRDVTPLTTTELSAERIDELVDAIHRLLLELLGDRLESTTVSLVVDRHVKSGERRVSYLYVLWRDRGRQCKLRSSVVIADVLAAIRLEVLGQPFEKVAEESSKAFCEMLP